MKKAGLTQIIRPKDYNLGQPVFGTIIVVNINEMMNYFKNIERRLAMSTYKKLFTTSIGLFLINGFILSQTISGSAHDFSSETWNLRGEICITCHIPHKADVTVPNSPLWNHQVTSSTFTPYSSLSLD